MKIKRIFKKRENPLLAQTQCDNNLGSRGDAEATISADLRFLLLCIGHRGALLLGSFRTCRADTHEHALSIRSASLRESCLPQSQTQHNSDAMST